VRNFLAVAFLICLISFTTSATAGSIWADPFYILEDSTGTILVRGPYSTVWLSPEKGDKIPEGHLLQTLDGAIAKLRYVPSNGSGEALGGSLTLKIDTPIVVRLDRDILRRVAVSTNFVEKLPALDATYRELQEEDFSLKSAWSKVTAAGQAGLARAGLGSSSEGNSKEEKGVQSSVEGRKINILTPYTGQKFSSLNLPHEILIKWKDVDTRDIAYRVYFWRSSRQRPPPVGLTRRNQFTVALPVLGKYLLQVTSEDGVWQSEVHSIVLMQGVGGQFRSNVVSASDSMDLGLAILYPSESFEVLTRGEKAVDFFRWDKLLDGREWNYQWVLRGKNGVELRRISTSESFVRQEIPAGEYLWHVEASVRNQALADPQLGSALPVARNHSSRLRGNTVPRMRSKSRLIRVIQTFGADQPQKRLSEFIRSGTYGSIYLTEGL
jgi:hypothetical protein